jgi:hypothetical protein
MPGSRGGYFRGYPGGIQGGVDGARMTGRGGSGGGVQTIFGGVRISFGGSDTVFQGSEGVKIIKIVTFFGVRRLIFQEGGDLFAAKTFPGHILGGAFSRLVPSFSQYFFKNPWV